MTTLTILATIAETSCTIDWNDMAKTVMGGLVIIVFVYCMFRHGY